MYQKTYLRKKHNQGKKEIAKRILLYLFYCTIRTSKLPNRMVDGVRSVSWRALWRAFLGKFDTFEKTPNDGFQRFRQHSPFRKPTMNDGMDGTPSKKRWFRCGHMCNSGQQNDLTILSLHKALIYSFIYNFIYINILLYKQNYTYIYLYIILTIYTNIYKSPVPFTAGGFGGRGHEAPEGQAPREVRPLGDEGQGARRWALRTRLLLGRKGLRSRILDNRRTTETRRKITGACVSKICHKRNRSERETDPKKNGNQKIRSSTINQPCEGIIKKKSMCEMPTGRGPETLRGHGTTHRCLGEGEFQSYSRS